MHDHQDFFIAPTDPIHKRYEALRAFYVERLSAEDIAQKFNWSENYFNKMRAEFHQALSHDQTPQFFARPTPGPQPVSTNSEIQEQIVQLRRQNLSIQDIKAVLDAKQIHLSLRQIDRVLKTHRFARLAKRSRREKAQTQLPPQVEPPKAAPIQITAEARPQITTRCGGVFFFVPLIQQLGLPRLIEQAGYPTTQQLSALNYILSLLFLKLVDKKRLSHIDDLALDAGAGLFAGLNVLPKSAAISSYSYKTDRAMDRRLLAGLHRAVQPMCPVSGEFNLDFTAIPHWGDVSALEKNWNGSRNKSLKSVLAVVVADPDSGLIVYGDTDIRHDDQADAVLEFIDFWKAASVEPLKCLIFDSKFTTYQNLSKINQDGIRFITLRRKGAQLIKRVEQLPKTDWRTVQLDSPTRKYTRLNAHDSRIRLKDYQGELRQITITGHGRLEPTFIITNDFDLSLKQIVTKYARRWLVEKCLSEQIHFFHLNMLSSSIVIKVDLDLTMTLVAHTLYHLLAKQLPGFEKAEAATLYRNFIETMADIDVQHPTIQVSVPKKVHFPLLFSLPMFKQSYPMPWNENLRLGFHVKNTT